MKNIPREKLLLIITCVSIGLLIGDKLFFTPLVDSLNEDLEEIEHLRSDLARKQAVVESHFTWERKQKYIANAALPPTKSETENVLLKSVSEWAREAGVALTSIRPSWKSEKGKLPSVDLKLSGSGTMPSVVQFIMKLETHKLPLKVCSLNISSPKNGRIVELGMGINAVLNSGKER